MSLKLFFFNYVCAPISVLNLFLLEILKVFATSQMYTDLFWYSKLTNGEFTFICYKFISQVTILNLITTKKLFCQRWTTFNFISFEFLSAKFIF